GVLTVMLLSLAGIPLTAGFMGKFYIITVGVQSALWVLLILLVINSVIGLFYYLRIIVWMSTVPEEAQPRMIAIPVPGVSWAEQVVLTMLTILLVWLGLYPTPFIRVIQSLS
ncbi:MAG: proton-conducting transporter membrane subunit, partial [Nitrospirales bacterium]